jgi:hypothetical protein
MDDEFTQVVEHPVGRAVDLLHAARATALPLAAGAGAFAGISLLLSGTAGGMAERAEGELRGPLEVFWVSSGVTALVLSILAVTAGAFADGLMNSLTSRSLVREIRRGASAQAVPHAPQWAAAEEPAFSVFGWTGGLLVGIPGALLFAAVLFGPSGQKPPWLFAALVPLLVVLIGLWWALFREGPEHRRRREVIDSHWSDARTALRRRGRSASQLRALSGSPGMALRGLLGVAAAGCAIAGVFALQLMTFVQHPLAHDTGAGIDPGPRLFLPDPVEAVLGGGLWLVVGLFVVALGLIAAQYVIDIREELGTRRLLEEAVEHGRTSRIDAAVVARASVRRVLPMTRLTSALAGILVAGGVPALVLDTPGSSPAVLTARTGLLLVLAGAVLLLAGLIADAVATIRRGPLRRELVRTWGLNPPWSSLDRRLRRLLRSMGSSSDT